MAGNVSSCHFSGQHSSIKVLSFRRIEKEGGGIDGDILGHSIKLVEYKPVHTDRVNYTIVLIDWLRVVNLIG
jgi:hypothetical protein